MNISLELLKKKILFWVNQGIIKEIEKNIFQLLTTPTEILNEKQGK